MRRTLHSVSGRGFIPRDAALGGVERILEHLDDLEDLCLAEQRLIDHRAGHSQTYTLEKVERELGLAF